MLRSGERLILSWNPVVGIRGDFEIPVSASTLGFENNAFAHFGAIPCPYKEIGFTSTENGLHRTAANRVHGRSLPVPVPVRIVCLKGPCATETKKKFRQL